MGKVGEIRRVWGVKGVESGEGGKGVESGEGVEDDDGVESEQVGVSEYRVRERKLVKRK